MAGQWRQPAFYKMPLFEGNWGESPDDHLQQFERYCLSNFKGGSNQFTVKFQGSLMASAKEWYHNLTPEQKVDWDALAQAFRDKFRSPNFKLECSEQLYAIRQYPRECVSAYSDRVRKLARLLDAAQGVHKRKTKQVWLRGLRPEFFMVEMNSHNRDFKACVQMALEQEYRLGGAVNQSLDLERKVHELEMRLQAVTTGDQFDCGYRPAMQNPPAEPIYGCEEEDVVANVQVNPWTSTAGIAGQANAYQQQQYQATGWQPWQGNQMGAGPAMGMGMGRGCGCFKCGGLDHMAGSCPFATCPICS